MDKLKKIFSSSPSWWIFIILLLLGALVIWFSPAEATLGDGIKPVYIHVPLTIVAKFLLYLSAGLGIATLFWPDRLAPWATLIFQVGFSMFFTGFLFSMIASKINWGNIPLQEPRFLKSANVLVVGLAVVLLIRWVTSPRIQGLLIALPPLFFITLNNPSTWVLHPDTAMRTAPGNIRITFLIMIVWSALIAAWGVWYLVARHILPASSPENE